MSIVEPRSGAPVDERIGATLAASEAAAPELKSMLSTAELRRRPSRPTDYASESHALVALARAMASTPEGILQKLADTALALCRAHTAGVSVLENDRKNFRWPAIAGQWACHVGGGTPRDFGPCGTVLDRNAALVCSHPERDFPYFNEVEPGVDEALLIPFYLEGEAVGTIWIVAHDESRRFDAEDLRVMTNLGTFASAAYQNLSSLAALQRIASIVESTDDAIASKTLDGIITTWNKGAEGLFGYSAQEVVGRHIGILIPPDRLGEESMILERIGRGERIEHYETVRKRKDGSLVPISLTISPIKNLSGEIVGASKIARDISAQKQKEEHITLLSREVDHRSKNLLTLVQAVVHLAQADTPGALRDAIEGRVQAVANAHALLEQSRWVGADIRRLVTDELSPYALQGKSRAEIVGPSLMLKPKSAQSIAIVLHELLTNAVKYGALSVSAGRIRVQWSETDVGSIVLRWTEKDGPAVTPPTRRGFGTRVIEQIIQEELKGKAHLDWRADGLACQLAFDRAIEF